MTPSSEEWSEAPDGLARLAAAGSTEEVRQRAFRALLPVIHRTAHRLALRFTGQQRRDLLDNAEGDVWEALGRGAPQGPFEAWCYTVLRNRHLDNLRQEQREQRHALAAAHQRREAVDLRHALERAWARDEPLGELDLRAVGAWSLRERLVLLCLSGLWRKVPPVLWGEWVDEHRRWHGTPPSGLFPPDELGDSEQLAERNGALARLLGLKRNTLSVCLFRGKARLASLRCVRELLETTPDGASP